MKGNTLSKKEININDNARDWIDTLFNPNSTSVERNIIKFLMRDFSKPMNTRSKEEGKYIIACISKRRIILFHSELGKKTLTNQCNVIERMLDSDNILRFVSFEKDNDNIVFYERSDSKFLGLWLGFSKKNIYKYYEGENVFHLQSGSLRLKCILDDEFLERNLFNNGEYKFKSNSLILPNHIKILTITKIIRNRKKYNNFWDFEEDLITIRQNLYYHIIKYQRLNNRIDKFLHKFVDKEDFVLEKPGIKKVLKDNCDFNVMYCDEFIHLDLIYLEKLYNSLINNEKIKLFHAGVKFKSVPIQINNFLIFNKINVQLTAPIIDYRNSNQH
jgi:hypothetical protein